MKIENKGGFRVENIPYFFCSQVTGRADFVDKEADLRILLKKNTSFFASHISQHRYIVICM